MAGNNLEIALSSDIADKPSPSNDSNAKPENLPRAIPCGWIYDIFHTCSGEIYCWLGINHSNWVRLCTLSLALVFCCLFLRVVGLAPPLIMLANIFWGDITLADYWVSEKLDDMRGYSAGEKLLARSGEHIEARLWFTAGWPKIPLGGELWAGHGQFSRPVSTVRKKFQTKFSDVRCTSWYSVCQRIQVAIPNGMRHYSLSLRKLGSPGCTMWSSLK